MAVSPSAEPLLRLSHKLTRTQPLNFFGPLSTANETGSTISFLTLNNEGKRYKIEAGVTADIGVSDSTKADSLLDLQKDNITYTLVSETSWPAEETSAKLTVTNDGLLLKSNIGPPFRQVVFKKK